MSEINRIKELIGDIGISDAEAEGIRDNFRALAEIIFEKWQDERKTKKETIK